MLVYPGASITLNRAGVYSQGGGLVNKALLLDLFQGRVAGVKNIKCGCSSSFIALRYAPCSMRASLLLMWEPAKSNRKVGFALMGVNHQT